MRLVARRKGSIVMTADLEELAKVDGALTQMAATVKTDRFLAPLVDATHRTLANKFDMDMGMTALNMPEAFHHVYEWGAIGVPHAKLWRHEIKGRGANRFAAWGWRASATPIPTPMQRHGDPNDPMSNVPLKKVKRLSARRHIFIWKAPVMEYNRPVSITPQYGRFIVFPVWDSKDPLRFVTGTTVINPGGDHTTMAFTSYWTSWWATAGKAAFESTIEKEIESGIENNTIPPVTGGNRTATVSLSSMSYDKAKSQGMEWADRNLKKFADRQFGATSEFWEEED